MAKRFWNWKNHTEENETVQRVLELNGTIAEESWFDDDVTPQMFKMSFLQEVVPLQFGLILRVEIALRQVRFIQCLWIIHMM